MYVPPHFREDRVPVLHDAIRRIGFATLIIQGADGMEANHLPMLLDGDVLRGHFARANPVWKSIDTQQDSLAIFLGPNTYVTPSWYPTKADTGKVVPTWNYLTVHVYGHITLFDDPAWLRELVSALTQKHESERAAPWSIDDAPPEYIDNMLRAIVGFELAITRLEGKWKMSQNRELADRDGVRAGLARDGNDGLAQLMPE